MKIFLSIVNYFVRKKGLLTYLLEPNIVVNKQHINTTEKSEVSNNIVVGDCVKIISRLFQGYYVVVFDSSYVDEYEISVLLRRKLFLGQNVRFSKKITTTQEKSVSSRKL